MAKRKKGLAEVGEGLQAIAKVPPSEPEPVLVADDDVKKLLDGFEEEGKKVQAKADEALKKCLSQLQIIKTLEMSTQSVRERPAAKQAHKQASDYVSWYLNNPDVTLRRAGFMALFKFYLGNAATMSPEQIREALKELVAKKALVETPSGAFTCLGRRYDIAVERDETATGIQPDSDEEAEVRHLLETAGTTAWQKTRLASKADAAKWDSQAELTVHDLMDRDGKNGSFCLGVYQPRRHGNGGEIPPKTGVVMGERVGGLLFLKDGTGPLKTIADRLCQARDGRGLAIPQDCVLNNLDDHTHAELQLRTRVSEDEFKTAVIGYWILHWGLVTTSSAQLHKEMAAEANISMEEALLHRKNGKVLIEVFAWPRPGSDEWSDGWIEDDDQRLYPRRIKPDGTPLPAIFFLAEFFQPQEDAEAGEGNERKIRVVKVPAEFRDLLESCTDSYPDDFPNLPEPLNRLLPAAYGETANKARRVHAHTQPQAQATDGK